MALYMDIHRNLQATPEAVRQAHISDMEAQEKHGVKYIKYWFNQAAGTVYCLVEGPTKEACHAVHREAHGLVADDIIDVESGIVEAFLGDSHEDLGCAVFRDGMLDSGFRTVLFTDLVESTVAVQKLGDDGAMQMIRTHDAIVRGALSACNGREVKHTGDGIMASFVSASNAVRCSIAIQDAARRNNAEDSNIPIKVRIGISAGEPVAEAQDLFGTAVHLARRVCDSAEGGRIFAANVVRELCLGKPFQFKDLGEHSLKGFEFPMRIHEVDWA